MWINVVSHLNIHIFLLVYNRIDEHLNKERKTNENPVYFYVCHCQHS
jgi:phage-related holin